MLRGLGYLTDELAALDLARGALLPYPNPITVKPGSFAVLADMAPDAGGGPGTSRGTGAEWQVAVGGGTGRRIGAPCTPALVIVSRYEAGAETSLTPLSHTEAYLSLALHAVNLIPHGAAGTAALGRLVARCACFALTMSDLDVACRLVQDLVADQTSLAPLEGAGRAR